MPCNDPSPTIAWAAEVDARGWLGQTVMDLGGGQIMNLPVGTNYYEDGINFTCGRGSQVGHSLNEQLQTKIAAGAGLVPGDVFLDVDDKIVLQFQAAFTLNVPGDGEDAYGWPTAGGPYASVPIGGGLHEVRAPSEWQRGNIKNQHLDITIGADNYVIPSDGFMVQDMIVLLRDTAIGDADATDATDNWEDSLNDVADNISRRYRCGITDEGHTFIAWPWLFGPTDIDASMFVNNADFMRFLGFDGTEQDVLDTGPGPFNMRRLTSTYPNAAFLVPERPARQITRRREELTNTVRLSSPEIASSFVMEWQSWMCAWHLDGPQDCKDLSTHYLFEFLPRNPKGNKLTLYQCWGDSRRIRFTTDVRSQTGFTAVPAYDLLGTAELDAYRGRVRAQRGIGDASQSTTNWQGDLRRRGPQTTFFERLLD